MRTRLSTHERREQLLAIGADLFAERPYDEVEIEEVAQIAGVSRGLLYHYFATKRDFLASVVATEAGRILALTEPDTGLGLVEQLHAGLEAYLDYVEHHQAGYRVLQRAAVAVDEGIRQVCEDGMATQQQRILTTLAAAIEVDETVEVAVRGWLMFVITVCLDWLDRPTIDRAELRDLCARTLLSAVRLERPEQLDTGTRAGR